PGKCKPYGAAFLDVSQRPAGIIKVRKPGRAAPPLSHQALVGLPWHQTRRNPPPVGLQHVQVVFVLQIQRNSGHTILSLYRGPPHGEWTNGVCIPPCAPGTPVWGILPRKARRRVACDTYTDASSDL